MSLPSAIRNIDCEPSSGWRTWGHDEQGLKEVGLIGIPEELGGFEGYYTKHAPEVTEPQNCTLQELDWLLGGIKPVEVDRDRAIGLRNLYDNTWPQRTRLRTLLTTRYENGDMGRDDDGNIVGLFVPAKPKLNANEASILIKISPLGRAVIREAVPEPADLKPGTIRVKATDFILDRFMPVPVRRVLYSNRTSSVHMPVSGTLGSYIKGINNNLPAKLAVRKIA